jgi:hypothetical protein
MKEASVLFSDTNNYFGMTTHYVKLVEDKVDLPDEGRGVPHTVDSTLVNIVVEVGRYIDITLNKEMANTTTEADVEVDGAVFFEKMSATALLNLEARLEELIKVYRSIPTLPYGEEWKKDDSTGEFISAQREQLRTEKQNKVVVLYDATKEHPAQTQLTTVDTPVYKVERTVFSGMLTPMDKKKRIMRLEKVQQAVKQARQRANAIPVVPKEYAEKLFNYVNS